MSQDLKQIIRQEYVRCVVDPVHFMKKYCYIQHPLRGRILFHLYPFQETVLKHFQENPYSIILKSRQLGISTLGAGYALWLMLFHKDKNVLTLATTQATARNLVSKVQFMYENLPSWLRIDAEEKNKLSLRLSNGSKITAKSSNSDAARSEAVSLLLIDEAAFVEGGQELWTACLASIGTGGKAVLISTPNGLDPIYYASYEGAIKGENSFCVTHLKWWQDPRFNKDLRLIKAKDIVDWIQKPNAEKHEEIIQSAIDLHPDVIAKFISEGYKPHSTWYENMCRDMNLNRRMINQELECAFIGSGDNVIEGEVLRKQETDNVQQPAFKATEWDNNVWVWQLPQKGHRYILALDVSRGDSEDATGMCIIDYDTFEQVLEYHGKVQPDIAAQLVDQYGRMYNALSTFDITGGMGVATVLKLLEMEYNFLHYDDPKSRKLSEKYAKTKYNLLSFNKP